MVISSLSLSHIRSYTRQTFVFKESGGIFVGPNGVGKTNILESLFLLATGFSFRASHVREVIQLGAEVGHIKGQIVSHTEVTSLHMIATHGMVTGHKVPIKKYQVNGVGRRLVDFAGILKIVLFHPQDLDVVIGSPSERRNYLNYVLVQTDREYRRSLFSYEKGIRQRNRLLKKIRDEGISRSGLLFWDQLLIKTGNYISRKRAEYIAFLNSSQWLGDSEHSFSVVYDDNFISESRLNQYKDAEVASAMTLVGPHRDDITFKIKNQISKIKNYSQEDFVDLSSFGSRGEQRLGVLWLKLGELAFMEHITGERPVLLLDDIFSELDHRHRDLIYTVIPKQQTIITTADPHTIEAHKTNRLEVVELA